MKNKFKSILYQFLTASIGNALVFLRQKKAQQLSQTGMTIVHYDSMGIAERLMRSAILKKVEKSQDYNNLEDLHKNYWINKGADFFLETEERFETEFLPNCAFVFDELERELLHSPVMFRTLVEIGTGNGKVLEYLSDKFPKINRFVGIDLSRDQIEINNEKFKENKKLEFAATDGFDWVKAHGHGNTIFVTSRGVLEYFKEDRLQALLNEISNLGKTMFVAIEPNGIKHDFEKNPNSEPYGHERSFSHNYPKLFKNAGFDLWYKSNKPLNESTIMRFVGAKN